MALDPQKIPAWAVKLIPYAERWNIGDDGDREAAIGALSDEEMDALAHCLDDAPNFWNWLANESTRLTASEFAVSEEHVAMTVLGMTVDYAKLDLAIRRGTHGFPGPGP